MMRLEIAEAIDARYVELYFHSEAGRRRLTKDAKWAVNQASINQEDVKRTPAPLPPLAEQEALVEAAEAQLSVIDHLEADLSAKLTSAQALRQSILRHAFSGKLVPQDSNDEPAFELLKRITAQREQRARETAAAKRLNGHQPCRAAKTRGKAARAQATKKEAEYGRIADR
jgi:type I restriction enzyme S subunit